MINNHLSFHVLLCVILSHYYLRVCTHLNTIILLRDDIIPLLLLLYVFRVRRGGYNNIIIILSLVTGRRSGGGSSRRSGRTPPRPPKGKRKCNRSPLLGSKRSACVHSKTVSSCRVCSRRQLGGS